MRFVVFIILTSISISVLANKADSTSRIRDRLLPNSLVFQFAGNIGMFSTGVRYSTPNRHWKGSFLYGFVPASYADDPTHLLTIKGQYSALLREYNPSINIAWVNVGIWYNYAMGSKYFSKLPGYYDKGYYYFSTAVNVGLTVGSEFKYKKWGFYFDIGTTDKRTINYIKSAKAITFSEIWNIGLGMVYHFK